jgi:hypothetical protein
MLLDVPPEQDFARSDGLWIIRLVSVIPKMRHKLKKRLIKSKQEFSSETRSIHNDTTTTIMKLLLQTIVFFGLYALASTTRTLSESSHGSVVDHDEEMPHARARKRGLFGDEKPNSTPQNRRRRNKASKKGKKSGGGNLEDRDFGLNAPCMPFDNIPDYVIEGTPEGGDSSDQVCLTENGCNEGCCRVAYTWLICDLGGSDQNFSTLQVRGDGLQYYYYVRSF